MKISRICKYLKVHSHKLHLILRHEADGCIATDDTYRKIPMSALTQPTAACVNEPECRKNISSNNKKMEKRFGLAHLSNEGSGKVC